MTPFGICKIVPPAEWQPPCQVSMNNPKRFPTKHQQINTLQQGQGFDDGKQYNIAEYKAMADAFYRNWVEKNHSGDSSVTQEALAKDYWNIVETNSRKVAVDYGNDLDTVNYCSGFLKKASLDPVVKTEPAGPAGSTGSVFDEKFYATTGWNLNNIPTTKGSLLQYLRTPINGINVPWLYVGMLFASFCWHNEDNYFYSISYNHFGATKQWYCVPGDRAANFEKVLTSTNAFLLVFFLVSSCFLAILFQQAAYKNLFHKLT